MIKAKIIFIVMLRPKKLGKGHKNEQQENGDSGK